MANVPNRVVENDCDRVYRLVKESVVPSASAMAFPVVTLYTYDKANNRTQKQMMGSFKSESRFYRFFNKFNQITSVAGASGQPLVEYAYDKNGNRITREVNGDLDTYTWDGDNRLVALYFGTLPFPEPVGGTLNPTIPAVQSGFYRYTYDYRTRRTLREERQSESVPYEQRFVTFSGGTSVQERNAPELSSPVPVFAEVPTPVLALPPTMTVAPSPVRRVLPPSLTDELHLDRENNIISLDRPNFPS